MLKRLFGKPSVEPPFVIAGAMNYLHGGSGAPKASVENADGEVVDIETMWRLPWRDDRCQDGTIPEEEAGYRFSAPNAVLPAPPVCFGAERTPRAKSGTAAPVSGTWRAESLIPAVIHLEEGEELPPHQGRRVRWVLDDR